jgi:hypothetical protein
MLRQSCRAASRQPSSGGVGSPSASAMSLSWVSTSAAGGTGIVRASSVAATVSTRSAHSSRTCSASNAVVRRSSTWLRSRHPREDCAAARRRCSTAIPHRWQTCTVQPARDGVSRAAGSWQPGRRPARRCEAAWAGAQGLLYAGGRRSRRNPLGFVNAAAVCRRASATTLISYSSRSDRWDHAQPPITAGQRPSPEFWNLTGTCQGPVRSSLRLGPVEVRGRHTRGVATGGGRRH